MVKLLGRRFDNALIRESPQSRGQMLHILTPLDFTEAACMEALPHQIKLRL
jgi:hypothetical protein